MIDESLKSVSEEIIANIKRIAEEKREESRKLQKEIEIYNELLAEAAKQGDLSENAEYHAAKEGREVRNNKYNTLLAQIKSLEDEISSYTPTGIVTLGTTVALKVLNINGESPMVNMTEFTVRLVQHDTGSAKDNLVAIDSRVGLAVLGHMAGDTVNVKAPIGDVLYKIERIY